MPEKYVLLKCVSGRLADAPPPTRVLRLNELRALVEADPELEWGLDPRGAIEIRNSDGSLSKMQPHEGFSFRSGKRTFFQCYEFYQGIAIHPVGDQRTLEKAKRFGATLGATAFEI